jgi:hypothetical protein
VRLRSDIFVSAYIRRCGLEGAPAVLRRRGAAEAGAIFVRIDRLDGSCTLYGPAQQSAAIAEPGIDRLFVRWHDTEAIPVAEAEEKLAREIRFDPDLWLVEVDDRTGTARLDLVER